MSEFKINNNAFVSKDMKGNINVLFNDAKTQLIIPKDLIDRGLVFEIHIEPISDHDDDGIPVIRKLASQPPPPPPPTKRGYEVFKEGSKYPMSEEELVARERRTRGNK